MTEQSSRELKSGVFTSVLNESEDSSHQSSVPGIDSKCVSSVGEVSESGVTSALDRAVAALENGTNNLLEDSLPSENVTTFLPSELELENQAVNQEYSLQRCTDPVVELTISREDDASTKKIRDFSELRAMFSEASERQCMESPMPGKKVVNMTAKNEKLDLDGIDSDACNEMHSEEESIVARMRRSFETTGKSSEHASFVNRKYKHIKPASFEVGLDGCVTRESSAIHDLSRTGQANKITSDSNLCEHVFRNEPSINSMSNCTVVEAIEETKQNFKEEEISTDTGNPSDSPKNIAFDINFDGRLSKRISPKTMPKPPRGKLLDRNTTEMSACENEVVRPVEREEILENQRESKVPSVSESVLSKACYSFEVSFEPDSTKKLNSRDRLNKLLAKKPRTDRSPGEVTETRDTNNPVTVEDKRDKQPQDEIVPLEPRVSSSQNQALHDSAGGITFDVGFEKDTTPETTKDPFLASKNKGNDERDEVKKKTQGISFDICFGEYSDENPKINRKSKLTAKHIRLKMTKSKQQQKNQKEIESNESTSITSSVSASMPRLITKTVRNTNERNTYTLEEVSNSLQSACERGLTLEDALDDLAKQQEPKEPTSGVVTVGSSVRDDVVPTKRGTYSLDTVATCLVSAADQGLTVADALDSLADSEEKVVERATQNYVQDSSMINAGDKNVNTGTYDFSDISKTIHNEKDRGNSLEEALIQLLGEVESVVKGTQKKENRGTYDLKDVSEAVQEASDRGVSIEKTLKAIAQTEKNDISDENIQTTSGSDKRKNVPTDDYFVDSENLDFQSDPSIKNRGTYPLDDVEKHLEISMVEGNSIVDALSRISKPKPQDSSALSKVNSNESYKLEETGPTRNTYTLDEVAGSLELAKSKGIPIVEALSIISPEKPTKELETPGSRGTYTLDEVAHSLETAREKGLPVVMALENLGLYGGGSLKGPAEAAVHRRQGKLTNRKTYALASPLETIGEEKQLRLFDGASRKLLPATEVPSTEVSSTQGPQTVLYDDPENIPPSGQNVVQTLDLLTSACEALLKTTAKKEKPNEEKLDEPQVLPGETRDLRQQFKAESRDSGISFPSGPSERGTYSLDDVSESLKGAAKKGIPVIEALGSLTAKKPVKTYRIPRALRKAGSKSESSLIKNTATRDEISRQTYSLDNVSNSMEDATAKGIPVIAALDELTNSLAKFSATRPTPGKPLKKPERPSIIRKKEAARKERAKVKSELAREVPKQSSMPFPISYPPAMRNSYSLDDVASAFEKAYQTGVPFQNVLEGMCSGDNKVTVQPREDEDITISTGSLGMEKDDLQSTEPGEEYARKSQSASSLRRTREFSVPGVRDSLLDGRISTPPRKSSTSSEGSLTYSSSYGSDVSVNRDSSSTEELPHVSKVSSVRKQRRQSSGPFQLKKGSRRNSPANLRKPSTSSSLQGDSVESLTSRDSETPDSSQLKRGTYDLKKVGEELDNFRIQGIQIVKGLDKITTEVSVPSKAQSKAVGVTPKRGTYSLEDVSRQLDSEKSKGDSVVQALDKFSSNPELSCMFVDGREIHRDSQSAPVSQTSVSENKTRNTFTLEHVGVSIADAASRGVPVVEALAKLSHEGSSTSPDNPADKPVHKTDHEAKTQRPEQDPFFIEYFPSKTIETRNFRVENGARDVEVEDKQESKYQDLDNYPRKDDNVVAESQKSDSESGYSKLFDHSSLAEETTIQNGSTEKPSERQMFLEKKEDKALLAGRTASSISPSRPKWQRSGSYIEALESFEEMLAVDPCVSSGLDSFPVKESNYVNGNYDKMYPENAVGMTETTQRGRSTWRPSATILEKILNLMDDHEEQGLSIADALEKAAELSERQGKSYNDAKVEDERWCSEKQKTSERENLLGHVGTKVSESNGFGNQGEQLLGYQVASSDLTLNTNQQDKAPLHQDFVNNGLRDSAPRHFWKVDNPKLPPSVVEFASALPSDVGSYEHMADDEVNQDPSSNKAFSIFIGDENDQTKEGLTPEQQKKRERFLRNRQKKMEEEKARREAENEKKKHQQEIEMPKRVRQISQATEEHPSRPTIREYRSPPKVVKSSGKSNRKMISNALCHACLSGAVNNDNRERCLQAMSESQGSHFIILLKDGLRFRGLFMYHPENEQAYKIYGTGPKIISSNMVDCVYKYSSGSKEFVKIPSKSLSISVDGVAIKKVYWPSNKPNVLSKTQSNLKRPPRPPQR